VLRAGLALVLAGCASSGGGAPGARPARSDMVKVDQVGYRPERPKLGMVTGTAARGGFSVRRVGDGSEATRGTLSAARADADSGDTVRVADFSALRESGAYYLDVEGVGASDEFEVGPRVFEPGLALALRAFYGQRCGMAVDMGPRNPGYRHAACHVAGTPNPDAQFHSSSGAGGPVEGSGGWHDAGDYGKYIVNSGISTGTLLWAYEIYPSRLGLALDIPESGNAVPDALDEVRWNLEWMLKMQDRDGGVWPKLTSERFGGFVMPESDDGGPRYVIGGGAPPFKSSCATGDFAAVMAIAARVYRPFDAAFAARALAAAEGAWAWVSAHPNVIFRNCCGVQTGEYGDGDCSDERLWAAAELFRTTGAPAYNAAFAAEHARTAPVVQGGPVQSWQDVRNMGLMAYALSRQPSTDAALQAQIRAQLQAAAQSVVARTNANPYRVSLRSTDYVWGSNGVVGNYGLLLGVANAVQPDASYLDAAAEDLHYLLGRNAIGLSYVTQLGDRPFQNPHHRPSGADASAQPWPGMLSGGPNRYGGDPLLDTLLANPPARCYRDDQRTYASNEIAINWQAPLVFLLATQVE